MDKIIKNEVVCIHPEYVSDDVVIVNLLTLAQSVQEIMERFGWNNYSDGKEIIKTMKFSIEKIQHEKYEYRATWDINGYSKRWFSFTTLNASCELDAEYHLLEDLKEIGLTEKIIGEHFYTIKKFAEEKQEEKKEGE